MNDIQRWRRDLHQIPELGLKEYDTTNYLIQELEKMGYKAQSFPNLETGCFVYIDKQSTETIAYRSDIDALPIVEENKIVYKSQRQGCMHACGHDGHMSALLGFAKKLKSIEFNKNVLLIFQPAEESPGAAKLICETDIFTKYHVKEIYGIHLMPQFDEGTILTKSGALMAECGEIDIVIHGKGSHAGLPEKGIDAIMIGTMLYTQLQMIVSRQISPFDQIILNIGMMKAGNARNAVAETCEMHGTMRGYNETLFLEVIDKMKRIVHQFEETYQIQIDFKCEPMYPPLLNDKKLFEKLKANYPIIELEQPLMLAEDFAYYGKVLPSLFIFVGTKTSKFNYGLHTSKFDFNEQVLEKAVEVYTKLLLSK